MAWSPLVSKRRWLAIVVFIGFRYGEGLFFDVLEHGAIANLFLEYSGEAFGNAISMQFGKDVKVGEKSTTPEYVVHV